MNMICVAEINVFVRIKYTSVRFLMKCNNLVCI